VKKHLCLLLSLFILLSPALAEKKKVTFDAQAALSYIKDLAADSMMGRKSGQPGGVMAEQYVASKFKEWGLEPAGNNNTYFQNFAIEHNNVAEGVVFEVITPRERRSFYYGDDWRIQRYSGSGHFSAEVVFVGYGIHAPEKGYDDYAGIKVKGKWVLFSTGVPSKLDDKLKEETKIQNRVKAAQELGAVGVLGFRQETGRSRYFRLRLEKEIYRPDFVILSVENRIPNFIFKNLKTELRYLFQEINKTSSPMSFETGVKIFVSVKAIFDEKRPTRNVLAKISGVDKNLKDEYVIIGAHMDHLGINPLGEVMNGANDNASGTAVVMEIARIMKLNHLKLPRTVIFALWAGEEQGLLGSRYYANHPLYPIEKTVAYINMDMVGHGNGFVPFRGVYYAPHIWEIIKKKLPPEILGYVHPGRGGPGGTDHTPFLSKGVPGYAIMTEGYHFKYHQSRDDLDLIKPELLKKTGDFVEKAVEILASEPGNLIKPMRQETYNLKYQTLINFNLVNLNEFIKKHQQVKEADVDLQLALVSGKEGLSGDRLRLNILDNLLSASEKIKKTSGLTFYSSAYNLSRDIRQGKTIILTGLKGIDAFKNDPRWLQILAKQGVFFVIVDNPTLLFSQKQLTVEGQKIVKTANNCGLLLAFRGLNSSQAKSLLETSSKPVIIMTNNLPDNGVMELIKQKKAALGLLLSKEDDPLGYFKKLDEAKNLIGSEHLMIVNQQSFWDKAGIEQMLGLITEILKAKYERSDMANIFSGSFLRVLRSAKGEEGSGIYPYIPF